MEEVVGYRSLEFMGEGWVKGRYLEVICKVII